MIASLAKMLDDFLDHLPWMIPVVTLESMFTANVFSACREGPVARLHSAMANLEALILS
jgi:hypothetical protein